MAKTIGWREVHDKLIKNDVQWTSINSFRVWYYKETEIDGEPGVELGYREFEIKPTKGAEL